MLTLTTVKIRMQAWTFKHSILMMRLIMVLAVVVRSTHPWAGCHYRVD